MTDTSKPRQPFHVRCAPCGHIWPVAYLPMEMGLFAKVVKAGRCPMCGSTSRHHFIGDTDAEKPAG